MGNAKLHDHGGNDGERHDVDQAHRHQEHKLQRFHVIRSQAGIMSTSHGRITVVRTVVQWKTTKNRYSEVGCALAIDPLTFWPGNFVAAFSSRPAPSGPGARFDDARSRRLLPVLAFVRRTIPTIFVEESRCRIHVADRFVRRLIDPKNSSHEVQGFEDIPH